MAQWLIQEAVLLRQRADEAKRSREMTAEIEDEARHARLVAMANRVFERH